MEIHRAITPMTPLVQQRQQELGDSVRQGIRAGTIMEKDLDTIRSAGQDLQDLRSELSHDGTLDVQDRKLLHRELTEARLEIAQIKIQNLDASATPMARGRAAAMRHRVQSGVERGMLDENELQELADQRDSVKELKADLAADGDISLDDRKALHLALNDLSAEIYRMNTEAHVMDDTSEEGVDTEA